MDATPQDLSDFYRLNEEIALELSRLERAGHLDPLLELLAAARVELLVASCRPDEGLEELLGVLRPRAAMADAGPQPQTSPSLEPASSEPQGASGGATSLGAVAEELRRQRGGWDHEGVLAARSQYTVILADGTPREVYMPDHVCPHCMNEAGNVIDGCARRCRACKASW